MAKIRPEVVIISLVVGGFVALSLFCNVKREGYRNRGGDSVVGSNIQYAMNLGVPGVPQTRPSMKPESCEKWFAPLAANTAGNHAPLAENELAIFSNNIQSPLCCPSTYSGSDGCVCTTENQMKYLNARGGNRVANSAF